MGVDRIERVNELLKREVGGALFRELGSEDIDISAFMVTRVITSRNLRHARVMISIRDHREERDRMLSVLKKHRTEIQEQINRNIVLKYTPRLSFELDTSVERGDHVLDVLSQLEEDSETEERQD